MSDERRNHYQPLLLVAAAAASLGLALTLSGTTGEWSFLLAPLVGGGVAGLMALVRWRDVRVATTDAVLVTIATYIVSLVVLFFVVAVVGF